MAFEMGYPNSSVEWFVSVARLTARLDPALSYRERNGNILAVEDPEGLPPEALTVEGDAPVPGASRRGVPLAVEPPAGDADRAIRARRDVHLLSRQPNFPDSVEMV
jgi:hypothetical protein